VADRSPLSHQLDDSGYSSSAQAVDVRRRGRLRISEGCLTNWLARADVEDGIKPGTTAVENAELRAAKRRMRLLERENEVASPVTEAELGEAQLANAVFDAHRDDPDRFLADEVRKGGFEVCDRTVWRICQDNGWWSTFAKSKNRKKGKPGTPAHDDLVRRDFRGRAEPAVARRHHRAPHRRRQALPLRDQGLLLEPDRRLGHRLPHEGPHRRRRDRDGCRSPR